MAKQTINNGETGLVVRGKLNDMFTELYAFHGAILRRSSDIVNPTYPYIMVWETESVDTDGFVALGTDATRITLPVGFSGIVEVSAQIDLLTNTAVGTDCIVQIRKNETGTTDTQVVAAVANDAVFGSQPFNVHTGPIEAVAADWFDVRIYTADATTNLKSGAYGCRFALKVLEF